MNHTANDWHERDRDELEPLYEELKYKRQASWQQRSVVKLLTQRWPLETTLNGCEVGVERGRLTETLLWVFPNLHLTLVDNWREGKDGSTQATQQQHDKNYFRMLDRTREYRDRRVVMPLDSQVAASILRDQQYDFVYIDADHRYYGCRADCKAYWPMVKPGGLMCGDDYGGRGDRKGYYDVKRAVDDWAREAGQQVMSRPFNLFWVEKPDHGPKAA